MFLNQQMIGPAGPESKALPEGAVVFRGSPGMPQQVCDNTGPTVLQKVIQKQTLSLNESDPEITTVCRRLHRAFESLFI